jgi:hypothetical protein
VRPRPRHPGARLPRSGQASRRRRCWLGWWLETLRAGAGDVLDWSWVLCCSARFLGGYRLTAEVTVNGRVARPFRHDVTGSQAMAYSREQFVIDVPCVTA